MNRYVRRQNLILLAILAIAALLRFYQLDASSLWHDEGNTWALIQRSFRQIAQDAAADIHPPGYYWFLNLWSRLFGTSAYAMRSLSAIFGVGIVAVTYAIGKQVESRQHPLSYYALMAAWIVALNPFQIYYSQEARMYALLTLESAGLFWALLALMRANYSVFSNASSFVKKQEATVPTTGFDGWNAYPVWPSIVFLFCGIAGLWTHYLFPVAFAVAGASFVIIWLLPVQDDTSGTTMARDWRYLGYFVVLNLIILLAYLPWLPTAIDRVFNWSKGGASTTLIESLERTLQTFIVGPLSDLPEPLWPWLLVAALLPPLGIVALRRHRAVVVLTLWLAIPIILMFALGLFSDAFLKFLLIASPAWGLLVAAVPHLAERKSSVRVGLQALLASGVVALTLSVLPAYYTDANARDNYAGVAAYIEAVGDPVTDIVLLNAPGQQEVWRYYDPGLPVLSVPTTRPVEVESTINTLADGIDGKQRIFALYWATDESDPDHVVESWLGQAAFKGPESWQGNMRFVPYVASDTVNCHTIDPNRATFDSLLSLEAYCTSSSSETVTAGDALAVSLEWQPLAEIDSPYKVSLQLLNESSQVIAQRDDEPGGGSMPTTSWQIDQIVTDNHALWIPFGTPPGDYRLTLVVYDPETGERLKTQNRDRLELGQIGIHRQPQPVPVTILPMAEKNDVQLGPVTLVGYNLYGKGFAHAPETPIQSGDTVELVIWWQAPDPLPADWPSDGTVTLKLGEAERTVPLANDLFPTALWQAGELVRVVYEIPYDGGSSRLRLTIDGETTELMPLPR